MQKKNSGSQIIDLKNMDRQVGFLFLFSKNYLSTIFYSDIIETVIYSAYMSSLKTSKEEDLLLDS